MISEVESPSSTTCTSEKDAVTAQGQERASTPPVMDAERLNEWLNPLSDGLTEVSPMKSFEQKEETLAATPNNKGERDAEIVEKRMT